MIIKSRFGTEYEINPSSFTDPKSVNLVGIQYSGCDAYFHEADAVLKDQLDYSGETQCLKDCIIIPFKQVVYEAFSGDTEYVSNVVRKVQSNTPRVEYLVRIYKANTPEEVARVGFIVLNPEEYDKNCGGIANLSGLFLERFALEYYELWRMGRTNKVPDEEAEMKARLFEATTILSDQF